MGELARKPGCPEVAQTPLELLTPRPGEGFNIVDKYTFPVSAALGCAFSIWIKNRTLGRPGWAGIHQHIIAAGVGWLIGQWLQKSKFAARSERDAVFKHYITLHPEDFPPFERQRFKDVYYPFKPIR